jgi:CRP/FNR family cyclic AMP-dependent transcriptional regulator
MPSYVPSEVVVRELRAVPLFADSSEVSDADLATLSKAVTRLAAKKNARIFEEATAADACYVMTEGRAKVIISGERGTEIILAILEPHSLVGELSLVDGSPRSAALVAINESRFLRIPADAFTDLRRKNASFQARLLNHVASTLRQTNEQLRAICSFQAVGRVAWCLSRLAARDGRLEDRGIVLTRPAHHEIAEMTGCSRETVTRALRKLKAKRCIAWDERHLTLDVDALTRYLRGTITFEVPRSVSSSM